MSAYISILGLGWLGLPLAQSLLKDNFKIKGSTTSNQKLRELLTQNYKAYKLKLTEKAVEGDVGPLLNGASILVLNTPPGLRRNPESNYVAKIKKLIPYIEASYVIKVIFISSTSVFQEAADFPVITNQTIPNAKSASGKQLYEVEQLLIGNQNFETTVLRFAGLIDERRHPASMMSKRKNIPNPKAPVNLIHRDDCIGLIKNIIKQNQWGKIFNAAYSLHPHKKTYYDQICATLNLNAPDFNQEKRSLGKVIDGSETANVLKYAYKNSILNT